MIAGREANKVLGSREKAVRWNGFGKWLRKCSAGWGLCLLRYSRCSLYEKGKWIVSGYALAMTAGGFVMTI